MKGSFHKPAAFAALLLVGCGREGGITGPNDREALLRDRTVLAIGVDSTTGASIETNKDDYLPGEVVHLVGRGWAAGETVSLHMTEEPNTHADVDTNVVVDASGAFDIHFYDVQSHDLGVTFTLTATGQTSGSRAVAVFTDGREISSATINTFTTVTVAPSASLNARVRGALTGNGQNTLGSIGVRAYVDGTPASTSVQLACFNVNPDLGPSSASNPILFDQQFAFNAPANGGVYDVIFVSYADNSCLTSAGSFEFPMNNAITVQAANDPPVVTAADASGTEGSAISLGGTVEDDDAGDVLSYKWTVSTTGIDASGTCTFDDDTKLDAKVTCTDDSEGVAGGKFTLTLEVKDGAGGHTVTDNSDLTVTNVAPTASFTAPASASLGSSFSISLGSATDAGSNDIASLQYAFDCGAGYNAASATASRSCTATTIPQQTVKGKVIDQDGGETEYSATVNVNNVPPIAGIDETSYSGDEGSDISISGTGSDPDGGAVTFAWSVSPNDGVCTFANATAASTTVNCTDNGSWTLTLTVKDDENATTPATASLTVANVAPTINTKTLGGDVNEGSTIAFGVSNIGDPSSVDVASGFTYAFKCGTGGSYSTFGASNTVTCPAGNGPGSVTIFAKAQDKDGGESAEVSSVFNVLNVKPTITSASNNSPVNEGSNASMTVTGATDPWTPDLTNATYAFSCNGGAFGSFGTSATGTCSTNDGPGTVTIAAKVKDDDGGVSDAFEQTITINNVAPTVTGITAPTSVFESSTSFNFSATSVTDPSTVDVAAGFTYAFSCDNGTTWSAFGTNSGSCAATDGPATINIAVKAQDKDGGVSLVQTASVEVKNVDPSVTINTPTVGQLFSLLNGPITVNASYSDPGADSHECQVELGAADVVNAYSAVSGGTCAKTITAPEAGVYTLTVRVKDDDNGVGVATVMIVVYDPSAGFVTGGGWIQSAAGNYIAAPTSSGKATFGFVSKYKKGATIPEGNTEFQYHAGSLNFQSSNYQWLVVNQAGSNAQFKGTGTINGQGNYTFMIWATDNGNSGDTFRIQITTSTGAVVYDNGAEQSLGGGSIVIHTGGKK
jgi:hypothetical protein